MRAWVSRGVGMPPILELLEQRARRACLQGEGRGVLTAPRGARVGIGVRVGLAWGWRLVLLKLLDETRAQGEVGTILARAPPSVRKDPLLPA